MKVYFKRVGYSNACFSAECKGELNYDWLYKQVKPYCKSRNIEFNYDDKTGLGLIFGGFHTIGSFRIQK